MSEKKKDKCEICGHDLVYTTQLDERKELKCEFCLKSDIVNIYCPNGHYICDSCHSKVPIEIIERFCEKTDIKDPFEMADKIMKHNNFKVYGPEHHVLTPAVILTTLKNNDVKKPNGDDITFKDIKEAIKRASKVPGGWCGFYGSCGAGMGAGIAISIFTGATPSKNEERTLANQMTSKALAKIADNLEHCCKRSVKISISETLKFLKEKFDIVLNYSPIKCRFSGINDRCEKTNCPIFN